MTHICSRHYNRPLLAWVTFLSSLVIQKTFKILPLHKSFCILVVWITVIHFYFPHVTEGRLELSHHAPLWRLNQPGDTRRIWLYERIYLLINGDTAWGRDRCSPNWVTEAGKSFWRIWMHRCMLKLIEQHVKYYANVHFPTNTLWPLHLVNEKPSLHSLFIKYWFLQLWR